MTNWSFDNETNTGTLKLAGEVTVQHVSDLKASLVEAFENAEQVTVDVSATTAVDVAGVQILCACHRFSRSRGKKMCLRLGDNTRFADFLEEVGFPLGFICNHGEKDRCVWASGS
jgi:anti-anti-sigma regulatory factor